MSALDHQSSTTERLELKTTGDGGDLGAAARELMMIPGIETADATSVVLRVEYDLRAISADEIIDRLSATGIALSSDWWNRLQRRLRVYRDSVARENLQNEMGWDNVVREVYVSRYRHRRHGRRDDRPRHWRQYKSPEQD